LFNFKIQRTPIFKSFDLVYSYFKKSLWIAIIDLQDKNINTE